MPMVQFSLRAMLELLDTAPRLESIGPERIVELMSHNPARLLGIDRRGFIREGYYADLVLLDPSDPPVRPVKITDSDVAGRCGWTPLAGMCLSHNIRLTMVNGAPAYSDGVFTAPHGQPLRFDAAQKPGANPRLKPPTRDFFNHEQHIENLVTLISHIMLDKTNVKTLDKVVVRFSGDSGDGMQLAGNIFTNVSAGLGNKVSTFPDYPAEVRAPKVRSAECQAFR